MDPIERNTETVFTNEKAKKSRRRLFPRRTPYAIAMIVVSLATIAFLAMLIVLNILPSELTLILTGVTILLLLLTSFLFASRRRWVRIVGIFFAIMLVAVTASVTGFMGNTYAMLGKISGGATDATGPAADSVNVTEEPFNVYITGIDQWEAEIGKDLERSDVNMIVTVNPMTKKILLTSIPRDSYIKLHTAQKMDKLTHTGVYGVDETLNTVEDWFGIDLNYYAKMNFTGAKDIINAMDGIRVYSPVAFDSSLKGYHYEKGWNKMGGSKALYFARERHAFEGQDAIRVENQQRVIEAVIKKMTSSTTLLTKYGKIVDAAGRNLSTNMSASEMKALVRMQATDLAEWDIQTQKVEGDYDMDYVASLSQKNKYSVYKVDQSTVRKCVEGINAVMNPSITEVRKAEEERDKSFMENMRNKIKDMIKSRSLKGSEE